MLFSCFAGCAGAAVMPEGPFTVRHGERVRVGNVAVTFADVVSDSRCPTNAQCIWAGDAAIRLILEKGSQKGEVILHTNGGPNYPTTAEWNGYRITLLELTPRPGEAPPEKSTYVAQLELEAA